MRIFTVCATWNNTLRCTEPFVVGTMFVATESIRTGWPVSAT